MVLKASREPIVSKPAYASKEPTPIVTRLRIIVPILVVRSIRKLRKLAFAALSANAFMLPSKRRMNR